MKLRSFLLSIVAGTLLAACTPEPLSFPQESAPPEAVDAAMAELDSHMTELYSLPSEYSHLQESIALAGAKKLALTNTDRENKILDQWCLALDYEVTIDEQGEKLLLTNIYLMIEKQSEWCSILILRASEVDYYVDAVAEQWETCLRN